jgi:hypothetical protein
MNWYHHIMASACFIMLGFIVTKIPVGVNPFWAVPWAIFIATPSIVLGIIIGMRFLK